MGNVVEMVTPGQQVRRSTIPPMSKLSRRRNMYPDSKIQTIMRRRTVRDIVLHQQTCLQWVPLFDACVHRTLVIYVIYLEYFLSIEHGGNITIFDTRRGKINTLEGGIKGNCEIRF